MLPGWISEESNTTLSGLRYQTKFGSSYLRLFFFLIQSQILPKCEKTKKFSNFQSFFLSVVNSIAPKI